MPVFLYIEGEVNLNTTDYNPDEVRDVFSHGQCHSFALALHKLTGWPLFAMYEKNTSRAHHVVVQHPSGDFVDVEGLGAFDRWQEEWENCLELRSVRPGQIRYWVRQRNENGSGYFPTNVRGALPFAEDVLANLR